MKVKKNRKYVHIIGGKLLRYKDLLRLHKMNNNSMLKIILAFFLIIISFTSFGQHIVIHKEYAPLPENKKPAPKKNPIIAETKKDTVKIITAEIPKKKKNSNELITECDFTSQPDKVPQLPYTTNLVDPAMIKKLKAKYEGRLYSITAIEAGNNQQNYKLRVCIKGKLQIEYVNEDGKEIDDPTLDLL